MKNTANVEYDLIPAGGLIEKILSSQRRKMFDAFMVFKQGSAQDTMLNVGMMATPLVDSENYLLAWSSPQDRQRITSYEIPPPPQLRAARASHRQSESIQLPFANGEFDWVFCNELIERVGGFERQYELVKELSRVARKGVFITTSNRKHPIEFNTALPFIHWLPSSWWRRILAWLGKNLWVIGSSLNLVDAKALYKLASLLPGQVEYDVGHKRVFGIKGHFFLMIEKRPARAHPAS